MFRSSLKFYIYQENIILHNNRTNKFKWKQNKYLKSILPNYCFMFINNYFICAVKLHSINHNAHIVFIGVTLRKYLLTLLLLLILFDLVLFNFIMVAVHIHEMNLFLVFLWASGFPRNVVGANVFRGQILFRYIITFFRNCYMLSSIPYRDWAELSSLSNKT